MKKTKRAMSKRRIDRQAARQMEAAAVKRAKKKPVIHMPPRDLGKR
jgi:hypothetical protein